MKSTLVLALCLVGGAMAARADLISYSAILDGPSESPPNASPGTGIATAVYDTVAHTLDLGVTFSGLLGTTTAAHIHAPTAVAGTGTAGVATTIPAFSGFPLGVTAGSVDTTLDLLNASSYNPTYVTANGGTLPGAEAALVAALAGGKAYLNIHSSTFGGGEIRGFLIADPVPEPAGTAAIGLGVLGAVTAFRRWRNQRAN